MKRARRWIARENAASEASGSVARLVALHLAAVGLFLLVAHTSLPSWEEELRHGPEHEAECEARHSALRDLEERTPPGDRDCLRFTRYDDGFGCESLVVSPRLGFLHRESGCMADWWLNSGTARWDGDELELSPRFVSHDPPRIVLPCRLALVSWGERQFLIGIDELDRLVNEINLGVFRERGGWAWHTHDEFHGTLSGHPELPPEHAAHLLDAPVTARVLASERLEPVDARGRWQCTFDLTLDLGTEHGLWVGMQLELLEDQGEFERAEVTSVAPRRAQARTRCFGAERRHAIPGPGWRASSRARE